MYRIQSAKLSGTALQVSLGPDLAFETSGKSAIANKSAHLCPRGELARGDLNQSGKQLAIVLRLIKSQYCLLYMAPSTH